jgi:hypothetical protein
LGRTGNPTNTLPGAHRPNLEPTTVVGLAQDLELRTTLRRVDNRIIGARATAHIQPRHNDFDQRFRGVDRAAGPDPGNIRRPRYDGEDRGARLDERCYGGGCVKGLGGRSSVALALGRQPGDDRQQEQADHEEAG